jgi:hypothetical protein
VLGGCILCVGGLDFGTLAVVLCSPVVVQLLRRLSSLSLSRKPPRSLNLSPKHFFAAILALYVVAFEFCFWSLVAIVH